MSEQVLTITGNTQILTGKKGFLSEFCFERSCISPVFCIDIQHVLPCCHDPLGRYGDEAEDKSLYATCLLDGSDNYLELVQNISRNFTNMELFRDKVVNKEQCKTM